MVLGRTAGSLKFTGHAFQIIKTCGHAGGRLPNAGPRLGLRSQRLERSEWWQVRRSFDVAIRCDPGRLAAHRSRDRSGQRLESHACLFDKNKKRAPRNALLFESGSGGRWFSVCCRGRCHCHYHCRGRYHCHCPCLCHLRGRCHCCWWGPASRVHARARGREALSQ